MKDRIELLRFIVGSYQPFTIAFGIGADGLVKSSIQAVVKKNVQNIFMKKFDIRKPIGYVLGNRRHKMDIAQEIFKIRQAMKLSREKFGQKIGVSFRTVENWESGKTEPSASKMDEMRGYADKPIDPEAK